MARAFWKGAISFGMVVIPVKMYVATTARTVELHMLHKKCLTRPRQVLHCEQDNEYFSSKETVRGYEYAKGQFVVLTDEDFEKVPVKTLHSIDIRAFVDASEIDPTYYYGSHYLEPEELGVRPFALLQETLRKTGRVGVAKVVFQRQEHFCCLQPHGDVMALHTMHYQTEVLPPPEPAATPLQLKPEELQMATNLVEAMARKFDPSEYKDEYHLALQQLIKAKVQGVEIKAPEAPKPQVGDLMAALRASIESARVGSVKSAVRRVHARVAARS